MSSRGRSNEPRINQHIRVEEVRLVDDKGEMQGVVSTGDALSMAKKAGLDLVEVSPNASPPVCKLLDYGKFKYEQQKKANEAKKKQKTIQIKEVKLRPNIDPHDFGIKMKAVDKFLDHGDKVKVTLRFRGREMAHQELGMAVLGRVKEHVAERAKIESEPSMEGRQAVMVMAPLN